MAGNSTKLIWPRIEKLRDEPNGIRGQIIDDIRKIAGESKLEYRSDIYKAIKTMGLPPKILKAYECISIDFIMKKYQFP